MRKSFKWFLTASLAALAVIGCAKQGDLDKMAERMDGIENRVSALEDAVKNLNETEVPNLVSLVRSLQGNITVKSVVETEDGYTITFSDGTIATLKNGVDGKDGINAKDGVGVASIEENEAGYLITFTDGKTIQVNHGQDGLDGKQVGVTVVDGVYVWTVDGEVLKDEDGNPIPVTGADGADGDTPKVSITLIEGEYYWTVNGAVLKDDAGNPIPVAGKDGKDGVTPQFGILDGHWVVSYDNGDTWKTLGLTSDTDYSAYIDPDKETDDYIVLVVGATEVQIPKEKAFTLTFTTIENNGLLAGETAKFPYVISGVNASDETDVDVIGIVGDWTAEVVATDNASGYLTVTATENMTAKVTVYAANHKGKTDIRTLKFEEGVLEAIIETRDIDWEGGELDLAVKTNRAYHIFIPAAAEDWITVTPETKVRTDNYTISVAKNESGAYRTATLQVLNQQGKSVKDIEILQYANPDAPTDLASVMEVPDEKDVYVNGVTVVAASKKSTIVTDGEAFSYITNFVGTPGTVISVTGVKNTDALGLGYVAATDVTMDTEAEPVEVDTKANYLYYGMGQNGFNYYYTSYNGVVAEKDGVYYLEGIEAPQQFVVEDPAQDLTALVGKLVALSGWVKTVDYEKGVKEDIHIVLTDVHEVSFAQEEGWDLYYGGPNSGVASYPEVIGNTVASPVEGSYYTLGVYSAAYVEQFESLDSFLFDALCSLSDDVMYYITLYNRYYGDDFDTAFADLSHSESAEESFREFPFGQYVIVAAGLDGEGRLNGKYSYKVFKKEDPAKHLAYEDFLGNWDVNGSIWKISTKEQGSTYNIDGIPGSERMASRGGNTTVVGYYDSENGQLYVKEAELAAYDDPSQYNYGPLKDYISGFFAYDGSAYPNFPTNGSAATIFTLAGYKDGTYSIRAGSCNYGTFTHFQFRWTIQTGQYSGQGNVYGSPIALPITNVSKVEVDMEGYNRWVGNWQFGSETWSIQPKEAGSSYNVTGVAGVSDIPVEARYNSATKAFELYEQENIATVPIIIEEGGEPVPSSLCLFANVLYMGEIYYWGDGVKIATAVLSSDNTAKLKPEASDGYGDYIGFTFFGVVGNSVYDLTDMVTLPMDVRPASSGASVKPNLLANGVYTRNLVLETRLKSAASRESVTASLKDDSVNGKALRVKNGEMVKARKF